MSMLKEDVADNAYDWLCLEHPPNIVTKHPQNFVKDSSSGDNCNGMWAIAVYDCSHSLCVYWAFSCWLTSCLKDVQ